MCHACGHGCHSVSVAEAAEEFGVSEQTIYGWLKRRALGGQFRERAWWVHLGPQPGEGEIVRLWHGTTADRIEALRAHGLQTATDGRQLWLTTNECRARRHAISRARRRETTPVLVECTVDLRRYAIFWRRSSHILVFHEPLGPEVIVSIQEVDERERERKLRMKLRKTTARR